MMSPSKGPITSGGGYHGPLLGLDIFLQKRAWIYGGWEMDSSENVGSIMMVLI